MIEKYVTLLKEIITKTYLIKTYSLFFLIKVDNFF